MFLRIINPISKIVLVITIRPLFTLSLYALLILSCKPASKKETINVFNGKDLSGWHMDVPDLDKDSSKQSPFLVRNDYYCSVFLF